MRLLKNGMRIGNATVLVDIVRTGNSKVRPGTRMNPRFLTDHDTGNAAPSADATMHNRYIHNLASYNPRDTSHVSWHITVDERYIIQHIPFDEAAYHCGDGWALTSGNRTSIGVEKCMHAGANREQIEANAIALYAYLMRELKIPIANVRPHQAWSGKYCPAVILRKYGSFTPFRNKIEQAARTGVITVSNPTPAQRSYLLEGDTGAAVRTLQTRLNNAGAKPALVVDGIFGKATTAAVRAFQARHGLVADGIYGAASTAKLTAVLAPKPVVKPTPAPTPAKPKEDDEMVDVAIVINSGDDRPAADRLAARSKAPVYTRSSMPKGKFTRELIVLGGSTDGLAKHADKITDLSGGDFFETVANAAKHRSKL